MLPAILAGMGRLAATAGAEGAAESLAGAQGMVGNISAVKNSLNQGAGSISAAGDKFRRAIEFVPNSILQVTSQIQEVANKWAAALYAPVDTLATIGAQLSRSVSKVNPAVVKQFEIAIDDIQGVMGRQALPVLVAFTRATREFGDYLVKIEPITKRLADVTVRMIDLTVELAKEFGDALVPAIQSTVTAIEVLTKSIGGLGGIAGIKGGLFGAGGPGGIGGFLGGMLGRNAETNPNPSSMGASIRNVRLMGSEDIQQEVARQSIMASMGAQSKEEQAQEAQISTAEKLQKILDWLNENLASRKVSDIIRDMIPNPASRPQDLPMNFGPIGVLRSLLLSQMSS